jgi:hypothetical protein
MTPKNGNSSPYRPVNSTGLGSSVFGWLRNLFGTQPSYRVPPAEPPPEEVPVEQVPEASPVQGETVCSQGPVTIVIDARD